MNMSVRDQVHDFSLGQDCASQVKAPVSINQSKRKN